MRALLATAVLLLASFPTVGGMHPQQAGSHATSFDHRTGNEWWVEVTVTGSPARVDARDDGGSWVALEKKSWGAWAKSFHIEAGHRVQFRAAWSDGASVESCWFTHPAGIEQCEGTPPPPPPPGNTTGNFTFVHGGGNEWWVEAKIVPKPVAVQAMDTGGAWVTLSFKSWGEWAASFRIEPGHDVRFRAHNGSGVWQESCWFAHPSGTPKACGGTPPPPAWPREGSFVRYAAHEGESVPGYDQESIVNVTYTFRNGWWTRECEGWYREWIGDEHYSEERILTSGPAAPPKVNGTPKPGETAGVPGVGCIWGGAHGTVFGPVRVNSTRNGSAASVVANYIDFQPVWPADDGGAWDVATKLVLYWSFSGSHSGNAGHLVDTDAPLQTATPTRTSWPVEGSFARYHVTETGGGSATLDHRFTNGGWKLTCTVRNGDGSVAYTRVSDEGPFHGPTSGFAIGDELELPLPDSWCHGQWNDVYVERSQTVTTTRNGASYNAKVWYADEDDSWEGTDFDVWWDTKTGLYLEFDHDAVQGKLLNTDAPLAAG